MGFMDSFKKEPPAGSIGKPAGPLLPPDSAADAGPDMGTLTESEHLAAKTAMQAVQDGDSVGFGRALKAFIDSSSGSDSAVGSEPTPAPFAGPAQK